MLLNTDPRLFTGTIFDSLGDDARLERHCQEIVSDLCERFPDRWLDMLAVVVLHAFYEFSTAEAFTVKVGDRLGQLVRWNPVGHYQYDGRRVWLFAAEVR